MNDSPTPAYRSYDGFFTFRDAEGVAGRCYLQIYEARAALPVVIAIEIADNPGVSITTAVDALASQVWQELLPRAREGFRLIEVYRHLALSGVFEEHFTEPALIANGEGLRVTQWHPSNRTSVEALIGDRFSVPVPDSN